MSWCLVEAGNAKATDGAPASELIEVSFGSVSLSEDNIEPNWESEVLNMTPVGGTVQFRWKDQGCGNRKGRLFLALMAPGAKAKAIFPLTEDFAPHHWDDVTVELEAREPVLNLARIGCWYRIVAEVGGGGGHELHVEDLVLRITGSEDAISTILPPRGRRSEDSSGRRVGGVAVGRQSASGLLMTEFLFGDASLSEAKTDPKWESEALQMSPTGGTVEFRWKDQGFGNRKGRIFLRLMAPGGKEKAIFPLTDDFASHHWDNITVELQARNPVLALATAGCWYQIVAEVGNGGGHLLHVEGFVIRLTGEPFLRRVGADVHEEQKAGQRDRVEPRCACCQDAVIIWRVNAWQTAVGSYLSGLTVLGFVVVEEMTVAMRYGLLGLMFIFAVVGTASAWVAFRQARRIV